MLCDFLYTIQVAGFCLVVGFCGSIGMVGAFVFASKIFDFEDKNPETWH